MNFKTRLCGLFTIAILVLISAPLQAQWAKVPAPKIPRGPDGKPNLSAPAPRLTDGHPDLSGIWEPAKGNRYVLNISADLKPNEVPYQPWAKALVDKRADGSQSKEEPTANCLPQGVPRIGAAPPPWKLIQTPGYVVIIYEAANLWRQIFLDGRELGDDSFRPGWAIQQGSGMATPWLSTPKGSMERPGWIRQASRPPKLST